MSGAGLNEIVATIGKRSPILRLAEQALRKRLEFGYDGKTWFVSRIQTDGTPEAKIFLRPVEMSDMSSSRKGLPPVGAVCERSISHSEWKETVVCGHSTDGAYAAFYDGDGLMGWTDQFKLRPIKTPEQIAEEAQPAAIEDMRLHVKAVLGGEVDANVGYTNDVLKILYIGGFRKEPSQ